MSVVAKIISELKVASGNKEFSKMTLGAATYGAGDEILGVPVPAIRAIHKKYKAQIGFAEIKKLLYSPIHEVRFLALAAMNDFFGKDAVVFYLRALSDGKINNWDLVDLSAPGIIGRRCFENGDLAIMRELAAPGKSLWQNRVAMVAVLHFIRSGRPEIVFEFVRVLANHPHHLIHKAMGWMLREAWKKIPAEVEKFLLNNSLPKTTIRYAKELM